MILSRKFPKCLNSAAMAFSTAFAGNINCPAQLQTAGEVDIHDFAGSIGVDRSDTKLRIYCAGPAADSMMGYMGLKPTGAFGTAPFQNGSGYQQNMAPGSFAMGGYQQNMPTFAVQAPMTAMPTMQAAMPTMQAAMPTMQAAMPTMQATMPTMQATMPTTMPTMQATMPTTMPATMPTTMPAMQAMPITATMQTSVPAIGSGQQYIVPTQDAATMTAPQQFVIRPSSDAVQAAPAAAKDEVVLEMKIGVLSGAAPTAIQITTAEAAAPAAANVAYYVAAPTQATTAVPQMVYAQPTIGNAQPAIGGANQPNISNALILDYERKNKRSYGGSNSSSSAQYSSYGSASKQSSLEEASS